MKHCWSEGALRAYLDRELPPEETQRAAAHIRECAACEALCAELGARAAHVAALVDLLPELEAETIHVPLRMPRRRVRARIGWVGAAVALAAGLGIAADLAPRAETGRRVVAEAPESPAAQPPAPAAATATVAPEERVIAVRPAKNRVRQANTRPPEAGDFVALDDEPFESGVVMRVTVNPGK